MEYLPAHHHKMSLQQLGGTPRNNRLRNRSRKVAHKHAHLWSMLMSHDLFCIGHQVTVTFQVRHVQVPHLHAVHYVSNWQYHHWTNKKWLKSVKFSELKLTLGNGGNFEHCMETIGIPDLCVVNQTWYNRLPNDIFRRLDLLSNLVVVIHRAQHPI